MSSMPNSLGLAAALLLAAVPATPAAALLPAAAPAAPAGALTLAAAPAAPAAALLLATALAAPSGALLLAAVPASPAAALLPAGAPAAPAPSAVAPSVLAAWGPPLLCRAFDPGEHAASLPPMGGDLDAGERVDRVLSLLETDTHSLVHMEALRRTVLSLDPARDDATIAHLLATLERRYSLATATHAVRTATGPDRVLALAALDLGFAREALAERGEGPERAHEAGPLLQVAVLAAPDDGALHLAASLVAFAQGDQELSRAHLAGALRLATDEQGLLCRNLCRTLGSMVGRSDRAALAAWAGVTLDERI